MMNKIVNALYALRPNSKWNLYGDSYADLEWLDETQSKPSQEEVDAEIAYQDSLIPLQDCKKQASQLLYETDWTTIPDVADPANTPYLTNQAAFIAWRSQIRALAVNPVANPVFPPKPDEVWG